MHLSIVEAVGRLVNRRVQLVRRLFHASRLWNWCLLNLISGAHVRDHSNQNHSDYAKSYNTGNDDCFRGVRGLASDGLLLDRNTCCLIEQLALVYLLRELEFNFHFSFVAEVPWNEILRVSFISGIKRTVGNFLMLYNSDAIFETLRF